MANFQAVPGGIFEEHRIVTKPFEVARPFDLLCPGFYSDPGQSVHIGGTLSPKCDPALVHHMLRGLRDAKKFSGSYRCFRFELQPAFDGDLTRKTQGGQEYAIEGADVGQTADTKIDVVISPAGLHGFSSDRR